MPARLIRLLHHEVSGLHEAAYLLALFALASQVLALLRDRMFANMFGADAMLDVYYAAFKIPDLIFVSIASFVSLYVLIPFLAEKARKSHEEERLFINAVFFSFFGLIVIVSILAFIFMPALVDFFFPGFASSLYVDELVLVSRIMLLQPIFLGISNFFAGITQLRRAFALYALSPLLYNIGIMAGLVLFYPTLGISGLGWGVVLGAVLHVGIQLPFIAFHGYLPLPRFGKKWIVDVKHVLLLSLPRTLALSANQLSVLVLISLAAFMVPGSVTVFQFAFNLQSVPLAVIGVSYSVAAFPTLARLFSEGNKGEFAKQMSVAARHILFWSVPAIVLFIVLRAQIVRVILGSGSFDWVDTRLTAAALALFSISLAAQSLALLFVRGYYAAGNTRIPLLVNLLTACATILFSYVFLRLFEVSVFFRSFIESLLRVEDLPGTVVLTLPLGFTIASLLGATAFWILFAGHLEAAAKGIARTFFEIFSASIVMGFVAYHVLAVLGDILNLNTFFGIFFQGLIAGITGIIAGVLVLMLLKNREAHEAWMIFHRKFWKEPTIAGEDPTI